MPSRTRFEGRGLDCDDGVLYDQAKQGETSVNVYLGAMRRTRMEFAIYIYIIRCNANTNQPAPNAYQRPSESSIFARIG